MSNSKKACNIFLSFMVITIIVLCILSFSSIKKIDKTPEILEQIKENYTFGPQPTFLPKITNSVFNVKMTNPYKVNRENKKVIIDVDTDINIIPEKITYTPKSSKQVERYILR